MRLCVIVLGFLLASLGTAWAQDAVVHTARVHDNGTYTRVVFELSEPRQPSIFTLAAEAGRPHRVVIDVPQLEWQVPGGPAMSGEGLVAQVRFGHNRPGWSRIVLDLPQAATISDSQVLPATAETSARIVIDLVPGDVEAFVASSGFPTDPGPDPAPPDEPEAFTDIEAVLASLGGSEPASDVVGPVMLDVPQRARPVIVIDPGHGGRDPGAITVNGTQEKVIALQIGLAMRDALQATNLFDVYMTRDEDILLPLNERYAVAQDLEADFFISVHVDSNDSAHARGVTVYTLSENASDDEAARVADRENQADRVAGFEVDEELTRILVDLAQRETMNLSAEMAAILVGSLSENEVRTVNRPHRFAGFRVLMAPDVPSILLETGFASNQDDADLLATTRYQQSLAAAMTRAMIGYFELEAGAGGNIAQNAAPSD